MLIAPSDLVEALNWFTASVLLFLSAILGWYFVREWGTMDWKALRRALERDAAGAITVAMFAVVAGSAINRLAFGVARHISRGGLHIPDWFIPYLYGFTVFGTILLAAGASCAIRVMEPERGGVWLWAGPILLSLLLAYIMVFV